MSSVGGHFIEGTKGPVFALLREPSQGSGPCVLVVPPLAEEMNKCRRMVTETALGLAAHGISTVVPDLYGTGDSGGEFEDADWSTWTSDVARVASWCASRGRNVTGLLAIRLGAALALSAVGSHSLPTLTATVLWQPLFAGNRWLTQFLRLRIAAMLAEDRKENAKDLLQKLRAGESVEIAGYALPGALAMEIESLQPPDSLPRELGAVHWYEVIREAQAAPPVAAGPFGEQARRSGQHFETQNFVGEPFWGAVEIVRNEALIAATVQAFLQAP